MLESTKRKVELLKEAGFKRNEFSCRTPQDNKGGWEDTKINLKVNQIKKNLGFEPGNFDSDECNQAVSEYVRERAKPLIEEGMEITEYGNRKYIAFSIDNSYKAQARYRLMKGTQKEELDFGEDGTREIQVPVYEDIEL